MKKDKEIINRFSKLSKSQKIEKITNYFDDKKEIKNQLQSFWHKDLNIQKLFDDFSENTISNFFLPYSVAPNLLINQQIYHIPMVIEESSVVAAAGNSAKFWSTRGGFHTRIISTTKEGQVHFIWKGDGDKLRQHMPAIKKRLIKNSEFITANMQKRGGGIMDIELIDFTNQIDDYYQLKATFETVDSMGANFINSCLEEFANELGFYIEANTDFSESEKGVHIIMSILSNYTPNCAVECYVECDISEFETIDNRLTAEEFVWKFEKAVQIAKVDVYRATTHNKGIFNGIDAVALATGNDFRAIEACGHAYACRNGKYESLTDIKIENGKFRYSLVIPMAMGTIGGLTSLHPLAKRSLELLDNPNAEKLMEIAAAAGLANNFGAIRTLITKGIQWGHMKMHLSNILNSFDATEDEKRQVLEHFKTEKVSFNSASTVIKELRN